MGSKKKIMELYENFVLEKWPGDPYNLASNFGRKNIYEFVEYIIGHNKNKHRSSADEQKLIREIIDKYRTE